MPNDVERAQELVLQEFLAAENRVVQVYDIIGYAAADRAHRFGLVRVSVRGLCVRVCGQDEQTADMLFRLSRGKIRPRWVVEPVEERPELQLLDTTPLYIRAPSFEVRTGVRESKFRYMFK